MPTKMSQRGKLKSLYLNCTPTHDVNLPLQSPEIQTMTTSQPSWSKALARGRAVMEIAMFQVKATYKARVLTEFKAPGRHTCDKDEPGHTLTLQETIVRSRCTT